MERAKLEEIIRNGENSGVEFKAQFDKPEDLAKEVVAFLNLKGGMLLLGVSDDGKIIGLETEGLEERIMNICRDLVNPSVIPFYEEILFDGKTIVILTISQGIDKPYCVFKNNRRTYYIRVGTTVREASREELRRLYQASKQIEYDVLPVVNSTIDDLIIERIEEYFSERRLFDISKLKTEDKLNKLVNSGILCEIERKIVCSVGGILLFGKEPEKFLSQSGIVFAHFAGSDITSELRDRKNLSKTIPENIQDLLQLIKINVPIQSKVKELKREEEIIYPPKVVREAVVNACVHRDYTILGGKIMVFLFDDKLVIKSPGRLPNGVTIEKMKVGVAIHRNPTLVKFMDDYNYMDKLGGGVPMIIREMKKVSGREPEIKEEGEEVILTLYSK